MSVSLFLSMALIAMYLFLKYCMRVYFMIKRLAWLYANSVKK